MSLKAQPSLQHGFSLIEVLVALIVIAIGLLGNAGMQALSINNTAIARNRSLAAIEADALASMMHANTGYWQTAAVPATAITVAGVQGSAVYTSTVLTNGPASANCVTGTCTATQMAGYDLRQWGLAVANLLPSGVGTITCTAFSVTAPVSCVIAVSWSENHFMLNQTGTTLTQNYTLVVQP